jgi:hypothetical protein
MRPISCPSYIADFLGFQSDISRLDDPIEKIEVLKKILKSNIRLIKKSKKNFSNNDLLEELKSEIKHLLDQLSLLRNIKKYFSKGRYFDALDELMFIESSFDNSTIFYDYIVDDLQRDLRAFLYETYRFLSAETHSLINCCILVDNDLAAIYELYINA